MLLLSIAVILFASGFGPGACHLTTDIQKIATKTNEKDCPNSDQTFYPHPTSCSKFIECNYGEAKVLECIDGLHYSPTLTWCDFPENVNCQLEDENTNTGDERCPEDGQHFYAFPEDCSKFVECNQGIYKVLDCIVGLHYNAEVGYCDFPENSNCEAFTGTEPESTTTSAATTTTIIQTTTTTTENPNTEGGPVGECPKQNSQYVDFLTDSKDCTVYYMCNWGTAIKMGCPSGLHFNPTINVCDWPNSAGCTANGKI
ncbi:chitin binding peritrophin-a [Holotrichia oblita]|uniref:Chitin binding peritrophin-a n=2 Tax=Holotrichia oblita TaxID=644536 RepID=A0ACB9TAL3_HOLOL|nr:chitin binding peritrophin-a [Holotrichia oblita]KAI4470517.1 chitin binding peritrophin-a [Holotrichia oblita]